MNVFHAIVLGLVQGLTEFLPVSSSGHLTLAQTLFGLSTESDNMLFNVLLHFGTLLSVIVAFWSDIRELIVEFFRWVGAGFKVQNQPYRRFIIMLLLSILPMFAILPIKSWIEAAFQSPLLVGCMLLVTAAILYLSEKFPKGHKTEKNARYLDGFVVGVCQCFAVLPGLSRSGTTMIAGLSRGFSRDFAVRFAFIMSLPVILGANILEVGEAVATAGGSGVPVYVYLVGVIVSMLSGLAAIKMVRFVAKRGNFRVFVVYCTAIGLITIIASLAKMVI